MKKEQNTCSEEDVSCLLKPVTANHNSRKLRKIRIFSSPKRSTGLLRNIPKNKSKTQGEMLELISRLKALKDGIGEIRWLNIPHTSTEEELLLGAHEVPTRYKSKEWEHLGAVAYFLSKNEIWI